jgi:phage terminase large subunit-like protein
LRHWAERRGEELRVGDNRLGERPRQVNTTTPQPIKLLKKLIDDPATALTRAGTVANAYNLAPAFLDPCADALHRVGDGGAGASNIVSENYRRT